MKGTLPIWIERLLGVDAAEAGEGTVWGLDHTWNWSPWATLLLLAACAGAILIVYLRDAGASGRGYALGLAGLRMAAVLVVLFMLAEFVLSRERTGLPYVVVLVDESASMGIADRYEDERARAALAKRVEAAGFRELTRLNIAKTLLLERDARLLSELEKDYKLRLYFLANSARGHPGEIDDLKSELIKLEPSGDSTRLGVGVRTVLNDLRGTPPTAIVLLSDGVTTEGETLAEAAQYAQRKNVPLYTIGLGSETPVRNLRLSDLLVDEVVFVDDVVNFEFKLTATGLEGRNVEVILREKDQTTPLAKVKATLGPDAEPRKVRLPYRPTQVGDFEYVVEALPLAEEDQAEDNRESRPVSVRKEQIRVLLVQSYPNYEYRYLKHMLQRDSTVKLNTVLQQADLEYATADEAALRVFPVRREELFAYDVLIFGDVDPAYLSSLVMENIAAFVEEKGGGAVFIAGPQFNPRAYENTPLARLFPIQLRSLGAPPPGQNLTESFAVQPTELGIASSHMQLGDTPEESAEVWKNLPGLYWLLDSSTLKPGARVLAEHPTRTGPDGKKAPIFVMQYVGAGKSLFHATDETWRWRYRVGDVLFARYWVQTIRYLSRSKLLGKDRSAELTAERREYIRGEPVRLRLRFVDDRVAPAEDDGVTVVLQRTGQANRQLKLRRSPTSRGVFEGTLSKPAEGRYHAYVASPPLEGGAPSVDFNVSAPPGEFKHVQMDSAELKRASKLSGGRFYTVAQAGQLLGDLPEGRQVPIETLEPLVLWNRSPLVLLFVGLLMTEWLLRKRKGLL